jgi:nucleoside-diphosphate-sugar epimerase
MTAATEPGSGQPTPTYLVTGVAGFIGSHLAERLAASGAAVRGVDCFTEYYARELKEANLASVQRSPGFVLHELDLSAAPLDALVRDVDVVFHMAGQPGVRNSWGTNFEPYLRRNVLSTQRLLEAARSTRRLRRFVYASSSSVYGDAQDLPTSERTLPQPVSPYGVTKLAAEHLCTLYSNLGVPTVSLRYFTVYGPRQRPDMAFTRFIRALLSGEEIRIHGDGEQTRDFTHVRDIVDANLAAASCDVMPGSVYNVGGGSRVTINEVVRLLEGMTGRSANVRHDSSPAGDARHTFADCSAARRDLHFQPKSSLETGLRAQLDRIAGVST